MTISRVILLAATACALAACESPIEQLRKAGFRIQGDLQTGEIEFKIQGSVTDSRLEIQNNPNHRCDRLTRTRKFKQGCFFVDEGDQGLFTFKFKKPADAKAYYFATFQLCPWSGGDTAPPRKCELTVDQRRDFSINFQDVLLVPNRKGSVDLSMNGEAQPESFQLRTSNLKEQVYFYWVDVCPKEPSPGPADCLTVDPGSRNGGARG